MNSLHGGPQKSTFQFLIKQFQIIFEPEQFEPKFFYE